MKVKGWTTKVTKTFEFFLKIFKIGTTILWIGPKLSERSLTSDSILEQISRVPLNFISYKSCATVFGALIIRTKRNRLKLH
jgi:hypothetical protein